MNDHELIQKVAKGDSGAFTNLLGRYKGQVYGTCYYILGDKSLAEDLSQETWIRVVKAASEYQPSAPLLAWILRIARNACFNELRHRKRWTELTQENAEKIPDEAISITDLLEDAENESKLKKAILELSPQQKLALMMVVQEEKSHAEIAQEIGCSVGAVKVLLFRARESLRKKMEET